MRVAVLLIVLWIPFQAHSQFQSFNFEVTANDGNKAITPVLFNRLEANTIFAAAVKNFYWPEDSLYLFLLDSCGNERESASLAIRLFPGLGHNYSVKKNRNGFILFIRDFQEYQIKMIFLDETLKPYSSFIIHDRSLLRVSPLGKSDVLISYFDRSDVIRFWLIDPINEKAKLYEPYAENEREFSVIQGIIANEKGEITMAGEFGSRTDPSKYYLFFSKYTSDLTNVFTRTYQIDVNLATPIEHGGNLIAEADGTTTFISHGTWKGGRFSTVTFDGQGNAKKRTLYTHQLVNFSYSSLSELFPMGNGYLGSANLVASDYVVNNNIYCYYSYENGITLFRAPDLPTQRISYNSSLSSSFLSNRLTVSGTTFSRSKKGCDAFSVLENVSKSSDDMKPISSTWQLQLKELPDVLDFFTVDVEPGKKNIEWTIENECPVFTKHQLPIKDTTVCLGTPAKLTSRIEIAPVKWNTGENSKWIFSDTSGLFFNEGFSGFCEVVDSHKVIVVDSIQLDLPDDTAACPKTVFDFNLKDEDYNYEWIFPDETRTVNRVLKTDDNGYHRLRVFGGGCEVIDSVDINFYGFPVAVAGPEGSMCKGDTFKLKGDGGETYLWSPADFLSREDAKSPWAFPPNTEYYRLVVTNKEGCTDTDFVYLRVHARPTANFFPGTGIVQMPDNGITFTNSSKGGAAFKWFVNGKEVSSAQHFGPTLLDTGAFSIKMVVGSSEGCLDSITADIYIEPQKILWLPNAFTPNGDGINDKFVLSSFYFAEYEMRIFNRWGQCVWKSRDFNSHPAWDGSMDNDLRIVPIGTYVYIINGKDGNGLQHDLSGKVHVVK